MQALIVRDRCDSKTLTEQLKSELSFCDRIVEVENLTQWERAKMKLNGSEPCLFFPNIFVRYRNISLQETLTFQKQHDFAALTATNPYSTERETISFIPDKMHNFKVVSGYTFQFNNIQFEYLPPPCDEPILFLYTHNRPEYLKLTLNSLSYSIMTPFPIKILLNDATPEVREIALSFAKNRNYVEIFDIYPNSVFSAINLALQWFKPEKFILTEDDFILPVTTRTYFPNWAHQFMDRLNHFEMVGWPWTLDNGPPYFNMSNSRTNLMNEWIVDYKNGYNLGGHCVAINKDFWLKTYRTRMSSSSGINPYYVVFDGDCQAAATKACVPALRGYHIGFNQEMDGHARRQVKENHPLTYKMISLKTGEEKFLDVRNL